MFFNTLSYDSFYEHLMHQNFVNSFLDREILQNYSSSESKYIKSFFSRGIYAILHDWINSEKPESPEELVMLIESIRDKFKK